MSIHKSVLLEEAIESLNLKKGDTVVDATLGGGGHSVEILERIGEEGRLIGIDFDNKAIREFEYRIKKQKQKQKQKRDGKIFLINGNFANLDKILDDLQIEKVDAILADLGYSSDQLEDEAIGMSFQKDSPLDMRLSRDGLSAEEIVNGYAEEDLIRILQDFGEEKYAKKIARKIVQARLQKRITRTRELVKIIESAVPAQYRFRKIHAATKTFQAIRIEANQELENLEKFIRLSIDRIKPGGRLSIISFHSLEDRIVKRRFRENARGCICPPELKLQKLQEEYMLAVSRGDQLAVELEKMLKSGNGELSQCYCGQVSKIKIITKTPVIPSLDEVAKNPRARSAKLRVLEALG